MPAPPPVAALPDELVEEILLRVPPDDPARLVRAALACKCWGRLVSGPGFRRRFRELHRIPPILGVLRSFNEGYNLTAHTVSFVPACSFRPPRADRRGWRPLDSRHGRVLLISAPCRFEPGLVLAVWDLVTDDLRELCAMPRYSYRLHLNAAVLCAAGDCDHLDCSSGPFLVVFMSANMYRLFVYVYSSEADLWSEPTSAPPVPASSLSDQVQPARVGNAVYFAFHLPERIIKYDLGTREMTVIQPPPTADWRMALTALDGGCLGSVTVEGSRLCLWSREAGANGGTGWTRSRVIDFWMLPPGRAQLFSLHVAGFADGAGVVFMETHVGCFITDWKSGQLKKVQDIGGMGNKIFPYMRFYTPALGMSSTGEGPRDGASSA